MNVINVNTNLAALSAQRHLQSSTTQLSIALQRVSSGLRINSARDDAAGLAIDTRINGQIRGMDQSVRNIADGMSLAQTAEAALASVGESLQRIRELAVQAANFTNSQADRDALQQEASLLQAEITRVGNQTSFNGMKLLDGTFGATNVQAGANVGETISIAALPDSRASSIGAGAQSVLSWSQTVTAGPSLQQTVQLGSNPIVNLGTFRQDAKLLAAAINTTGAASIPGLSATAASNVRTGSAAVAASTTTNYTFTLNDRTITIQGTTNATTNRANAVAAINAQTPWTGVVAADLGSGLQLTESGGGNIRLSETTTGSANFFGLGGLVSVNGLGSTITINYTVPANSPTANLVFTNSGMSTSTFAIPQFIPVSTINLSTVLGANTAITGIDSALDAVNQSRASLGATMNRFVASINAQRTNIEAQTASRSRIRDADLALETASMTRAQILQQSGMAILAQANSLPKNVLSLLK